MAATACAREREGERNNRASRRRSREAAGESHKKRGHVHKGSECQRWAPERPDEANRSSQQQHAGGVGRRLGGFTWVLPRTDSIEVLVVTTVRHAAANDEYST